MNARTRQGARRHLFLSGCGRSGKTLLAALLSGHEAVVVSRHEDHYWRTFAGRFGTAPLPPGKASNLVETYARHLKTQGAPCLEHRILEWLPRRSDYHHIYLAFLDDYAMCSKSGAPPECMVSHSGWFEHVALHLLHSIPRSLVIHVIRDPRDRVAAVLASPFHRPRRFLLGQVGVEASMWANSVLTAKALSRMNPDRFLVVRYEDIVAMPHRTMEAIWAFLRLDPVAVEGCLERLESFAHRSGGPPAFGQLTDRHVGTHQSSLGAAYARLLDYTLWDLLCGMGYERANQPPTFPPLAASETVAGILASIRAMMFAWRRWYASSEYRYADRPFPRTLPVRLTKPKNAASFRVAAAPSKGSL